MTALVYVFLSLLLAVYSRGSVSDPPHFVYRADFRQPHLIFEAGMESWGTCENVYYHVKGKSCTKKTSAFIATSESKLEAMRMAKKQLDDNPKEAVIFVYKIRATENFYSAYYSLVVAEENLRQQGKNKKADKYKSVAKRYFREREWMAYKQIAATQIQLATPYLRALIDQKELPQKNCPDVKNDGYVDESTYGSEDPFPESMKGCPAFGKLKACLGF